MAEVLADLVGRLSFDADDKGVKKFTQGVDDLAKASDVATTKGVALGTFMGNLATKAIDLAAALGKAAVAASVDLVHGFMEMGDELDKTSTRLGITSQELQRLDFAAGLSGASGDELRNSLRDLTKNLGELSAKGSGPAKDALGLLGLELKDLQGLDATTQLGVLADALKGIDDAGTRSKIAMDLMGEGGVKLLPMLDAGSEGIARMAAEADELGLVLSDSAVASAVDATDAMAELKAQTSGIANVLAAELTPMLLDAMHAAQDWLAANQDWIREKIPEAIDAIVEGVTELAYWGQELAGGLENLTGLFVNLGEEGEGAMGGLAGVLETLVGWSKAGIETFVEWTDDVAELADVVWDVAGAIKDGLVTAYEAAEGVIDRVSDAIWSQLGFLDPVVEFLEGIVERVQRVGDMVGAIVDEVGLGRAFSPEDVAAIDSSIEQARSPADARRYQAQQQRDMQQRELEKRSDLLRSDADAERRRKGGKYGAKLRAPKGGGGTKAVDTAEAEAAFGVEFRALASAAGVGEDAVRAALKAAASVEAGSSQDVARAAGVGKLESLSGADLSHAGGVDAAMFGLLSQAGGPQAARSAADGARFVQVTNTFNVTNTFELALPQGFGDGLQRDTEAVGGSLAHMLTEQWEAIMDRHGGGLEP